MTKTVAIVDTAHASKAAGSLAALGEPSRVRIIDLLRQGQRTVTEIAALTNLEVVKVSHHLRVLKNAGLVVVKPCGRQRIHALDAGVFTKKGDTVSLDCGWCEVRI